MMTKRKSWLSEIIRGLWHLVDMGRRVTVNLIFLALAVLVIAALLGDRGPTVEKGSALVIAPRGPIVDQLSGNPEERALARLLDNEEPETLLRDVLEAIDKAGSDDRIQALVLDLNRMGGTGQSHLQDVARALGRFEESGKPVIATADSYGRSSYYLAAQADEIYLHDLGLVAVDGFARYRTYYREGLDRLGLDVHVFRVGTYKSAVEPYLRDDMSPAAREANLDWLGDLWDAYVDDVTAARGLEPGALTAFIDQIDDRLQAAHGQMAQAALDAGLVDRIGGRDLLRQRLIDIVGEDEESHSFRQIGYRSYLNAVGREVPDANDDVVGVVVARGTILDGTQPPGTIGGDSTAALIRKARHDEHVKALVLRVDSGGGSVFASEVIRRELELTRIAGKPVVASMADVAASGGYFISMAADEIWASSETITGSIGIFAVFPTWDKPLAKYLGMHVDGVATTWLAGALRPDRALDPRLGDVIQQIIENGYNDFITKVAAARHMSVDEVDAIAGGRVWSGDDAHRLGLVDKLGGLEDAVASAATLAGLGDTYGVRTIQRRRTFREDVLLEMVTQVGGWMGTTRLQDPAAVALASVEHRLRHELELFGPGRDPKGLYAYCFCEPE